MEVVLSTFWLVYEHRRRSLAEIQSRNTLAELASRDRLATAGQLSASIAHEINQPLTGMVLKASAALRWLTVDKPDVDKVRNLLTDIVNGGHRAAELITSIRAMFKNDANAKVPINLNNLINTVLALLRIDLQKDGIWVETQLDQQLPVVIGDAVQLQTDDGVGELEVGGLPSATLGQPLRRGREAPARLVAGPLARHLVDLGRIENELAPRDPCGGVERLTWARRRCGRRVPHGHSFLGPAEPRSLGS